MVQFENIDYKFFFISKDSLVSRAKNNSYKFLDDDDFDITHLFFLDADIDLIKKILKDY